jgi:hypothetical protein
MSLTSTEAMSRYKLITIAIAKAVSAAATAMINTEKIIPSNKSGYKYLLITAKLITEAFKMSSTDMSIEMIFFLVKKP